jgi:hypothetical protein
VRNFNKRSFTVQALQHTKKKFKKVLQRGTIEDRGRSLMADQASTSGKRGFHPPHLVLKQFGPGLKGAFSPGSYRWGTVSTQSRFVMDL